VAPNCTSPSLSSRRRWRGSWRRARPFEQRRTGSAPRWRRARVRGGHSAASPGGAATARVARRVRLAARAQPRPGWRRRGPSGAAPRPRPRRVRAWARRPRGLLWWHGQPRRVGMRARSPLRRRGQALVRSGAALGGGVGHAVPARHGVAAPMARSRARQPGPGRMGARPRSRGPCGAGKPWCARARPLAVAWGTRCRLGTARLPRWLGRELGSPAPAAWERGPVSGAPAARALTARGPPAPLHGCDPGAAVPVPVEREAWPPTRGHDPWRRGRCPEARGRGGTGEGTTLALVRRA
jgi:hypothetical protein